MKARPAHPAAAAGKAGRLLLCAAAALSLSLRAAQAAGEGSATLRSLDDRIPLAVLDKSQETEIPLCPGSAIAYQIRLANITAEPPAPLNAFLEDPIPEGTAFVLDSETGEALFDPATHRVLWNGWLAPGEERLFGFAVRVDAGLAEGSQIVNRARATVMDALGRAGQGEVEVPAELACQGGGPPAGDCPKLELRLIGDPALCLPAPAAAPAPSCKEYEVVCCCIDTGTDGEKYSATRAAAQAKEVRWSVHDSFFSLEAAKGTAVRAGGQAGEYTSTLTGESHRVKVCLKPAGYEALRQQLGEDCFISGDFEVEGVCQEGDEATEIPELSIPLFVARSGLEVKACVRNVKKKGAPANDPAHSQAELDEKYLEALTDKLNQVYSQACVRFKVEKGEDIALDGSNFSAEGVLDAPAEGNPALIAGRQQGCINLYVVGQLPNGDNGGTPAVAEPPYTTVDDSAPPITHAHELGHYFGWKLLPTSFNSPLMAAYGKVNLCRPPGAEKTDLLMFDFANRRTDRGLLTEQNLLKMQQRICAAAKP